MAIITLIDLKRFHKDIQDSLLDELRTLVPSLAHDNSFMDWLASYLRSGGSPKAALILHKQCTNIDVTI